jgi:two-component system sensor histidine kinase KdpD
MTNKEAISHTRGRLKVFLGYASGVGKSFRMFDEGRRRRERGQDVVVGALQPEVPAEIQTLLGSLEIVPTLKIKNIPAIDVQAILQRHPQICLIDGLAYDNPPGIRNAHRWQDVEELLSAGITIVASVNLQYIDDQSEAVERLTGKRVTETVPREFLNTADEIVIIVDSPTETATEQRSVLREMALVFSANVIDVGLQRYLHSHGIEQSRGTRERFLICLTPRANFERMVTTARRNAARFHCDVLAVYVRQAGISDADRRIAGTGIGESASGRRTSGSARRRRSRGDHRTVRPFARHNADFCWTQYEERPENAYVRKPGEPLSSGSARHRCSGFSALDSEQQP